MRTKTKRQLMTEAEKHGAAIEYSFGMDTFVEALAPDGKVWSAAGVHILCANSVDGDPIGNAYDDLIDRMQMGTEACPRDMHGDGTCDTCDDL